MATKKKATQEKPEKRFSQGNKWFSFDNRIINLNHVVCFEIRMTPSEPDKIVEKPYSVIAFMNAQFCPCWNFKTEQEAKDWIDDLWESIYQD